MTAIKITCPACGKSLEGDNSTVGQSVQCAACDTTFTATAAPAPIRLQVAGNTSEPGPDAGELAARLGERLTALAGVDKLSGFSLRDLFSEVLRKHTSEEIEDYFTVGTRHTTPPIGEVDTSWPRPWVFFRTFVGALIVYLLFLAGWNQYANINLVPGLIMVGSFAVPTATLIFFVEINARRNVSLYQIIRLLFLGGIVSIVLSLVLFELTEKLRLTWLGDSVAGLVEESGKLLALLTVTSLPRYRYRLNGLLFGAAVGTGFAAFESAGYALRLGLHNGQAMTDTIMVRGMLSPFAHIAWTAMCGAALWKVKGAKPFAFTMVKDLRFLRVFAIAVVLHMVWNSDWTLPFHGKHILLGAVAWVVILALIQDGLKELREEKAATLARDAGTPA